MALTQIRGRVAYCFVQDDFDVDQIIGIENIKSQDMQELSQLAMRQYDRAFTIKVRAGDVLVGGRNFGYGHPHYPAMQVMRHLGIAAVIAESFAPGYWRNEMNMGFPQITCPGVLKLVRQWDDIDVDWHNAILANRSRGSTLPIERLSQSDMEILEAGGFIPWLKREIAIDADQS